MPERRSGAGRGKDDLVETLRSLSARIQAAVEKCQAAQRVGESLAARVVAMARALEEFNATAADVRREMEANLREATQVGDLRRCVEFKRALLKFEKLEQAMNDIKAKNRSLSSPG